MHVIIVNENICEDVLAYVMKCIWMPACTSAKSWKCEAKLVVQVLF
jgi:hypothetical protein